VERKGAGEKYSRTLQNLRQRLALGKTSAERGARIVKYASGKEKMGNTNGNPSEETHVRGGGEKNLVIQGKNAI